MAEFVLPELGENVAGGDVLRVLVKPGDTVAHDQPVLELETDKATIEVPSAVEGKIVEVRVAEGQRLKVGDVVLVVEGEGAPKQPARALAGSTVAHDALVAAAADVEPAEPEGERATAQASAEELRATSDAEVEIDDVEEAPPAQDRDAAPVPAGPVEFTLPSLGENIAGGDVLRVLVSVGDQVTRDQALLELETDKATIEVPSSVAGRITEVRVKEGGRVEVGDIAFVIEASGGSPAKHPPLTVQRVHAAAPPPAPGPMDTPTPQTPESVAPIGGLQQRVHGRIRRPPEDKPGMLEVALEEARAEAAFRTGIPRGELVTMTPRDEAARRPAPAAPSVRRVARELGVDIHLVTGSGPGGRISAEDVKAFVKKAMSSGGPRALPSPAGGVAPAPPLPDFSKWGAVERKPMRAVRRKTAEHLAQAWVTVPHVTQSDKADITQLEELRSRFAKRAEAAGGKLTITAIALKVVAAALRQFPQFNASVDMAAEEVVFKRYVHVGVAVDTDRGLLVPVIRDVDRKNIVELSVELAAAAERARTGKTSLEEMQGGCFTITNLGGIGGTSFTPIVNHPEVAILGISRGQMEPVWRDGQFVPRLLLPLSLSYDHRVIDGADGIRFLRWVAEALEQPFLLSLQG